jgi:hypothetical protein
LAKKEVLATTLIKMILGVCLKQPDVLDLMSCLSVYRPATLQEFNSGELTDLAKACAKRVFSSLGIDGKIKIGSVNASKELIVAQARAKMRPFPGIGVYEADEDLTFKPEPDIVLDDYSKALNAVLVSHLMELGIAQTTSIDFDT